MISSNERALSLCALQFNFSQPRILDFKGKEI